MKKLLLYSHNSLGLGHFMRSTTIAAAVRRLMPDSQVLLVTGSRWGLETLVPAGADLLKLPSFKGAAQDGRLRSVPVLDALSPRQLASLRSELILRTVRAFDPDVMVVDHSPEGLRQEMRKALDDRRRRSTVTVLGLRGVMFGLDATADFFQKYARLIDSHYDHVLVYTDRNVIDLERELQLPPRLAAKLHYTGYVTRASALAEANRAGAESTSSRPGGLIINAGAGTEAEPFFDLVLDAVRPLMSRARPEATVVLGPYIDAAQAERLAERAEAEGMRSLREHPQLHGLIKSARLFIGRGGYNTIAEVIAGATPAIIVNTGSLGGEAAEHAGRLERLGHCRLITVPGEQASLGQAIEDAWENGVGASEKVSLDVRGAEQAAQLLASFA